MLSFLPVHIVQSPEWGIFKTRVGKRTFRVGEIQFSTHKLPLFSIKIGYCPKVDLFKIRWKELIKIARDEGFCVVRFDVPNILKTSRLASKAKTLFQCHCRKSPTDTFAKRTIILDLTKSEGALLANMHPKTRYNIRLAQRKGVEVRQENDKNGLEIFLKLQKETAERQKFFIHPDDYYRKLWEILSPRKMVYILVGYFRNEPLVAWMVFSYKDVLYYPYGGSSVKYRNLMASNLMVWEAILLGKSLGCKIFDMWGVGNPEEESDPWAGFTRFKLGYGGEAVEFIDSYDLIMNPLLYQVFTFIHNVGWKILRLKRKIFTIPESISSRFTN